MDYILASIKKLLGIQPEYKAFDDDIIIHINTVFMMLNQLGVGPEEGFSISHGYEKWSEYCTTQNENAVRTFYNLETGKINYFHIDIMDGKFVEKDTTMLMKDYALTISHISNLGLDVHFMVENVEEFIDEYAMLEPEIMTFHIEATKTEERTKNAIEEIKRAGSRVGISISPDTDLESIKPYLGLIHMVLVMTVVPGKGGQKLIPETLEKVKMLKEYIDENGIDIDIEVDGGINAETASKAVEAGANILVSGTAILMAKNFKEIIASMFCLNEISKEENEYNPADALAAKIADKFKKRQALLAKKSGKNLSKIDIFSRYISILAVGEHKDMNELMEYTVYQLKDEFKRFQLKQDFDCYLKAKLAGAKDLEEVDNWMDDIHPNE